MAKSSKNGGKNSGKNNTSQVTDTSSNDSAPAASEHTNVAQLCEVLASTESTAQLAQDANPPVSSEVLNSAEGTAQLAREVLPHFIAEAAESSNEANNDEPSSNEQSAPAEVLAVVPAAAETTAPAEPEAPKAKRDRGARCIAIYNEELPKRAEMGDRAWRRHVQTLMMTTFPGMSMAASASHYNTARIQNGGTKNTRGPRKPKDTAAGGEAAAGTAAAATTPAATAEVWVVEQQGGAKSWYAGEEQAREKAAKLPNVIRIERDLEVEAEG